MMPSLPDPLLSLNLSEDDDLCFFPLRLKSVTLSKKRYPFVLLEVFRDMPIPQLLFILPLSEDVVSKMY